MNYTEVARLNMVESQIRPNDITDRRITRAMSILPRELFVPESLRSMAYMDEHILIKPEDDTSVARYLMAAMPLSKLVQLAEIDASDVVLDVGCTTGYSTIVLSHLCESVVGLESDQDLADIATKNLSDLNVDNAVIVSGPLKDGHEAEGPYDVIFMNGSVPKVSDKLLDQLKDQGHLVVVHSNEGFGKAYKYKRVMENISKKSAFDASVPELPGFEQLKEFVF